MGVPSMASLTQRWPLPAIPPQKDSLQCSIFLEQHPLQDQRMSEMREALRPSTPTKVLVLQMGSWGPGHLTQGPARARILSSDSQPSTQASSSAIPAQPAQDFALK